MESKQVSIIPSMVGSTLTSEMQRRLNTDGYVVLDNFLSCEELEILRNLVATAPLPADNTSNRQKIPVPGYTIFSEPDATFRRHHNNSIKAVINPKLKTLLPTHRAAICTWYRKGSNSSTNNTPLHQDSTHVPEPDVISMGLWFTLTDVDLGSSCLQFAKGSHALNSEYRPIIHASPYDKEITDFIDNHYLTPVPLKAGQAILHYKHIFHNATANLTNTERVAFICLIVPKEQPILHVYRSAYNSPTVEIYEVEDDFYNHWIFSNRPSGKGVKFVGTQHYSLTPLTTQIISNKLTPLQPQFLSRSDNSHGTVSDLYKTHTRSLTPEMLHRLYVDGYLILENFIEPDELQQLSDLVNTASLPTEHTNGLGYTIFNEIDPAFRARHNDGIKAVINPRLKSLLPNHCASFCTWYRKSSDSCTNTTPLHQDSSHNLNSNTLDLNIWFPLSDVDVESGCLHVVKGSHVLNTQLRPFCLAFPYSETIRNLLNEQYLRPIPLKAGQAILYDKRLFHSASANCSDNERVAISCVLRLAEQPMYFVQYSIDNPSLIEIYEVPDEFYNHYRFGDRPSGQGVKLIQSTPYTYDPLTPERIAKKLNVLYATSPNPKKWAIETAQNALNLNPHSYTNYLDQGDALAGENRLQEARECYRRALDLRPITE